MKTLPLLVPAAALAVILAVTAQTQQQVLTPSGEAPTRLRPALAPFPSPAAMQAEFVRRFEASPGFGLSRVVRPVFLAPVPMLVWNGATYTVTPPELLGLEDEPIAYAPREHGHRHYVNSDTNATRREIGRQFEHRPLTALETNAVLALREGRELIVLTNHVTVPEASIGKLPAAPGLFVLGALRAGKSCMECHQCKEGALLGAFAYNLTPAAAPLDGGTNSFSSRSNVVAWLDGARLTARLAH